MITPAPRFANRRRARQDEDACRLESADHLDVRQTEVKAHNLRLGRGTGPSPESGHLSPLEQPTDVTQALIDLLRIPVGDDI
jgi:hypothetical protein